MPNALPKHDTPREPGKHSGNKVPIRNFTIQNYLVSHLIEMYHSGVSSARLLWFFLVCSGTHVLSVSAQSRKSVFWTWYWRPFIKSTNAIRPACVSGQYVFNPVPNFMYSTYHSSEYIDWGYSLFVSDLVPRTITYGETDPESNVRSYLSVGGSLDVTHQLDRFTSFVAQCGLLGQVMGVSTNYVGCIRPFARAMGVFGGSKCAVALGLQYTMGGWVPDSQAQVSDWSIVCGVRSRVGV